MISRRLASLLLIAGLTAWAAGADAQLQQGADKGFLTVTSTPPAHVMIDGTDTGKMTPVDKLPLAAGRHKVTLFTDSAKRSFGIEIAAGQEKKLNVNL